MSWFPYVGPMTTDDIFAEVYRRSARSLSCRDRMCGADDCDNCRPNKQDSEQQNEEQQEEEEENK